MDLAASPARHHLSIQGSKILRWLFPVILNRARLKPQEDIAPGDYKRGNRNRSASQRAVENKCIGTGKTGI